MDKEHGGEVRSALYVYHRGQIERELGRSGPARRHLAEALRINPNFSPLSASAGREALAALGEPPAEGLPDLSEESDGSEETGETGETGETERSGQSEEAVGSTGAAGSSSSPRPGSAGTAAPSAAPEPPSAPAPRPSAAR